MKNKYYIERTTASLSQEEHSNMCMQGLQRGEGILPFEVSADISGRESGLTDFPNSSAISFITLGVSMPERIIVFEQKNISK